MVFIFVSYLITFLCSAVINFEELNQRYCESRDLLLSRLYFGTSSLGFLPANLAMAAPLAWYVMNNWLQNFAFRVKPQALNFVLAALGALLISWITVSWQTWKAARTNPVNSLKYE